MFFIVNKTKSTIVISDIAITLGPRQAIDLDKMMSRSKSNSSKMLKAANKRGQIDIRIKDGGKTSNIDLPKVDNSLDDFKKEIIGEIKDLFTKQIPPTPKEVLNKKDLAELAQKIIQNMPKSETVFIQEKSQKIKTEEEVIIDEEILVDINARAVDDVVKDVKSNNMRHKEDTKMNDLEQNILELENLLG